MVLGRWARGSNGPGDPGWTFVPRGTRVAHGSCGTFGALHPWGPRGTASKEPTATTVHCGAKSGHFETSIIHFPKSHYGRKKKKTQTK